LGILRKGAPKPEDSDRPGKDLTYFRFVTDDAEADQAFHEVYGPEPREIQVMLPFATKDENLSAWMEEHGSGSIKHRCDGTTCVLWQDDKGQYHTDPKPCPGGCKPTGELMVIIPELKRLAYVMVKTTSWNDCRELAANLAAIENTASQLGRDLRGIPFKLTRVEREVSCPPTSKTGGKRVRRAKWLLHIEAAPEWVALQIEAAHRLAMPMLPEPDGEENDTTVDAETGEIINGTAEVVEPEPVTNGNGNEHDIHDVPNNPKAAFAYVNQHVQVPYDAVRHMFSAIKGHLGDNWNWPKPDDADGWNTARSVAIAHAEAKVNVEAPETESETVQQEMPI